MVFSIFVGQKDRSSFIQLDNNGWTRVYRLFPGQPYVQLWRNRDFPTAGDDPRKSGLKQSCNIIENIKYYLSFPEISLKHYNSYLFLI